jgi:hypothetical protein
MERPMTPIPTHPILLMIPPELIQGICNSQTKPAIRRKPDAVA